MTLAIDINMRQKIWDYLHRGWQAAHNLHTAQWIILGLIALLPASVTTALISFMGEHSTFFLGLIFLLCFATISTMVLAILGHPLKNLANSGKRPSSQLDQTHSHS